MQVTWRAHTLSNTVVQATGETGQCPGCCWHAALRGSPRLLGAGGSVIDRSLQLEGLKPSLPSSSRPFSLKHSSLWGRGRRGGGQCYRDTQGVSAHVPV